MATHIKNIIQDIIDQNNEESWKIYMISNWDSIIGNLKTKVRLEKIQNDTLILGVYDSSWMQELFLLSNDLINNINSKLNKPYIKQIRFKKVEYTKIAEKKIKPKKYYAKIELTSQELVTLKKIKDPELSQVLRSFLIRCHQHKQEN